MSTMTEPVTLPQFLLARIAEDEDRAERFERDYAHMRLGDYGLGGMQEAGSTWFGAEQIGFTPQRVRAECEAKRRIVEALGDCMGDDRGLIWASVEASRAEEALTVLALPYADHPDYREAWRP